LGWGCRRSPRTRRVRDKCSINDRLRDEIGLPGGIYGLLCGDRVID
jgi:hypothetical protein